MGGDLAGAGDRFQIGLPSVLLAILCEGQFQSWPGFKISWPTGFDWELRLGLRFISIYLKISRGIDPIRKHKLNVCIFNAHFFIDTDLYLDRQTEPVQRVEFTGVDNLLAS